MNIKFARLALVMLILALLAASCVGNGDGISDVELIPADNLTATFGAEVFHAQLTAMAQEDLLQTTPLAKCP